MPPRRSPVVVEMPTLLDTVEAPEGSSTLHIPTDIVVGIADYIWHDRNTILGCALACREWYAALYPFLKFRSIRIGGEDSLRELQMKLEETPAMASWARELTVDFRSTQWAPYCRVPPITKSSSPVLLEQLTKLYTLVIDFDDPDYQRSTEPAGEEIIHAALLKSLRKTLSGLHTIRELSFCNGRVFPSFAKVFLRSLPNLHSFTLRRCWVAQDCEFAPFPKYGHHPNLTYLSMSSRVPIPGTAFRLFPETSLQSVRTLELLDLESGSPYSMGLILSNVGSQLHSLAFTQASRYTTSPGGWVQELKNFMSTTNIDHLTGLRKLNVGSITPNTIVFGMIVDKFKGLDIEELELSASFDSMRGFGSRKYASVDTSFRDGYQKLKHVRFHYSGIIVGLRVKQQLPQVLPSLYERGVVVSLFKGGSPV